MDRLPRFQVFWRLPTSASILVSCRYPCKGSAESRQLLLTPLHDGAFCLPPTIPCTPVLSMRGKFGSLTQAVCWVNWPDGQPFFKWNRCRSGSTIWFYQFGPTMKKQPHGNGSGKFEIGSHDMGGWVRICAGRQHLPENLPVYLS